MTLVDASCDEIRPTSSTTGGPTKKHETLVQALRYNAKTTPNKICLQWMNDKCEIVDSLTYKDLLEQASRVTAKLIKHGVQKGDRVMVAYPFGLDVVSGMYGCMLMGVIPCSVYPPNPSNKNKAAFSFEQFNNQVKDAGAKYALTTNKFKHILRAFALTSSYRTRVEWLSTDKLTGSVDISTAATYIPSSKEAALIQYSSGSTGEPKGVVLSHAAIIHNMHTCWAVCNARKQGSTEDLLTCLWLPQYHDYALIAFIIGSCYSDKDPSLLCSPIDFIKNPMLWADMIEKHKANRTAGPNFAYSLLSRRLKAAGRRMNGESLCVTSIAAEPIHPSTIEAMIESGFPESTIVPCYGMAEMCAFLTGCYVDKGPRTVDGILCCGESAFSEANGTTIIAVETRGESNQIITDGSVGELCIRSPSMALGYWNKPELTKERFQSVLSDGQEHFRTGDLGRVLDGYLFVAGRCKELIIINGKNIYPTDIERVVEATFPELVRPGSTVAFQSSDSKAGLVLELRSTVNAKSVAGLNASIIRRLVSDAIGVELDLVTLLKQGTVPKTTSGKLRRVETKDRAKQCSWNKKHVVWTWLSGKQHQDSANSEGQRQEAADTDPGASFDHVLVQIFGEKVDPELTWEELGLTSLASVELRDAIASNFFVDLQVEYQENYPTPVALKNFVNESSSNQFPVQKAILSGGAWRWGSRRISWTTSDLMQAIGIILLLLTLAFTFVPVYHLGKVIAGVPSLNESIGRVKWQWLPFVIPAWMLSMSCTVIAAKWLVVGSYQQDMEVPVPSIYFLRWWFVDRLVHVWEFYVGAFIKDTPIIWLFYFLLGAKIHPTASIDAFIREFDLVEIGAYGSLEFNIACRRFSAWDSDNGLRLRFRKIRIGARSKIQGVVSLGANIDENSQVERLSAIPEGAQVPSHTIAKGSPATNHGHKKETSPDEQNGAPERILVLAMMKIAALVVELYLFFSYLLFGQWIFNGRLPAGFRYTPLLYWGMLLLISVSMTAFMCIVLKWVLIGRKRPGAVPANVWHEFADWFVDYHFRVSLSLLDTLFENGKIINLYLRALGADIDFASHIWAVSIPPSKADLISVKRTFFSTSAFDLVQEGKMFPVSTIDSSFAHNAVLLGNATVKNSQVPPQTVVTGEMDNGKRATVQPPSFLTDILSACLVPIILASAVPAYELFQYDVSDTTKLLVGGFSVVKFAAVLALQTLVWMILYCFFQKIVIKKNKGTGRFEARSYSLYEVYLTVSYFLVWNWSLLRLLWGTPFINWYFRSLGAKVEGRMLYFALSTYDFPVLTFQDHTVLDRCIPCGHSVTASGVEIGPTVLAGTVHEGCVVLAHTDLSGVKEFGPLRSAVPKRQEMNVAAASRLSIQLGGADASITE